MSSGMLTRTRSVSTRLDAPQLVLPKGKEAALDTPFEPSAATASHFLFAQGSTVLVLHHDSLAQERRFSSHTDNIQFIAVDNVSERGAGRLVVTYDIGKTAIVWDLFTGEQLSRFASYEPLLVASWMRNGNIAFGNEKGDVILFEPSTSEHVSSRTIYDPITALAPSSDCKTYAIGYRNGSILLAALQPQFTILHTLATARSPSPIATLTWHASSSKQKSDMLAIQASDGDLRVWSVPKPPTSGIPRVIRILKREDRFVPGRNWISWSKNGRILQFSEGETWAWDVRTKDVNYLPVPTVEFVRSMAAHGPTAALFTLGPDYTVQQYDVEAGQMVANVRCLPPTVPPTPPDDHDRLHFTSTSEDDDVAQSPINRQRHNSISQEQPRQRSDTPQSHHSRSQNSQSTGSRHSDSKPKLQDIVSPSKTEKTTTSFSAGAYGYNYPQSGPSPFPQSTSPASARPGGAVRKASRLRQEVVISPMTPEETPVPDLFPYARARLTDISHSQPKSLDESNMTPDDLRQQMLSVVFGWDDDIEALVLDELKRQTIETQNGTILLKWLGYDPDAIAEVMGSNAVNPALDWMRLALGTLDNSPATKKLGQVFVEKMLSKGEIHLAVVALLCMGDRNDAIEVYVSRNCFLEAILLTCLLLPSDWQRQSHLVRRWGEHVVENSQQHLAIRCFSCTGMEPAEPWMSPTAHMVNQITSPTEPGSSQSQMSFGRPMLPPGVPALKLQTNSARLAQTPVAMQTPPTPFRHAAATGARITPQTGGLKLITSFGNQPKTFKFPGLKTDDMTPIQQQNVTPIAESAIDRSAMSPGGFPRSARTLNSALSAGPGLTRPRLPSIGETPVDVEPPPFPSQPQHIRAPPTPADSGSEREKEKAKAAGNAPLPRNERPEQPPMLLTSARYTPKPREEDSAGETPQTALRPTPALRFPRNNSLSEVQEEPSSRNGSRGRKPDLSLQVLAVQEVDQENTRSVIEHLQRPSTTQSNTTNFDMSPPDTGLLSSRMKSPSVSGRSIDQYISSLEQAHFYDRSTKSRNASRTGRSENSERKKSRSRHNKYSEDFDSRKEIPAAKRSPSSPVPMSPDDLRMLHNASVESFEGLYSSTAALAQDPPEKSRRRRESESATTGRRRHRSRSAQAEARYKHAKEVGRYASPVPDLEQNYRGRSKSRREASTARSPSSPLPMVPSEEDLQGQPNVEPALRFVSQDRSRLQRSTSRRPERGTSSRRELSSDRQRNRDRSESRQPGDGSGRVSRKSSVSVREKRRRKRDDSEDTRGRIEQSHADAIEQLDAMAESIKQLKNKPADRKKELAQAELEARRLSLARRPSAPTIPMPGQNNHSKSASEGHAAHPPLLRHHTDQPLKALPRNSGFYDVQEDEIGVVGRGRPGTPRAMQRPAESNSPVPAQLNLPDEMSRSETYQLPPRTYSANTMREQRSVMDADTVDSFAPADIPEGMPRHHAFDSRVSSNRGNSHGRARTQSPSSRRNRSVSRGPTERSNQLHTPDETPPLIIGSPEWSYSQFSKAPDGTAIIPELQHLAVPPPPPPPPAPPKDLTLKITPDMANAANIPLPRSAFPGYDPLEPKTSTSVNGQGHGHKREKSGSESQFMGKIRGITDRMRSASKTRDNVRSPPLENAGPSPYETNVGGAMPRQNMVAMLQSR